MPPRDATIQLRSISHAHERVARNALRCSPVSVRRGSVPQTPTGCALTRPSRIAAATPPR